MLPRLVLPKKTQPLVLLMACMALVSCGGGSDLDTDDGDIGAAVLDDALGDDGGQSDTGDDGDGAPISGQAAFSGLATFVIDGKTYELLSDQCIPEQPDALVDTGTRFSLLGSGQTGGDQMVGKVIRSEVDLDGDGEEEVLHTISIEIGAEEGFQAPPAKPSLLVQLSEGDVADGLGVLSVDFEPGRLSGTGEIFDRNGVLADGNEPLLFTFVATCVPAG